MFVAQQWSSKTLSSSKVFFKESPIRRLIFKRPSEFGAALRRFVPGVSRNRRLKLVGSDILGRNFKIFQCQNTMAGSNSDSAMKNVTHCIFDMDGLLIDSETVYKKIYSTICQKYGYTYGGDLAFQVLGRPEQVGAELIIKHYNLPVNVEQFQEVYHRLQKEYFNQVDMMPGANQLLRHLKKHNIPIALATSSSSESYALKTKHLSETFDLFHHKVLGGSDPEVKEGKPSPDIFLVAAKRFSDTPSPDKCLVFEDAPNGVQAAISAGMQVVMVPDKNIPKELTTKATIVLNSLENFQPELFGLPKFDS